MKSSRILLLFLALCIAGSSFSLTISDTNASTAVPAGQQIFTPYNSVPSPVVSEDPSQAEPVGVGSVATGGNTISLQIALGQFSGRVDIYFAIKAPSIDPDNVYLLTDSNVFRPVSAGLRPWIANTFGDINEPLLGDVAASALPPGSYSLYLLVTPAGRLDSYFLWTTQFTVQSHSVSVADNVIPVSVNGSLCSADSYPNKPCVSVTVCTPGTTTCQTINDILLDTGSYGLRIFRQALNVPLAQVSLGSGLLAECVQFGDGSSDWGPVQMASVVLGNEPPVPVPIQVIDSTFGIPPRSCRNGDLSPYDAGFNGILGVGFFAQDCGVTCSNSANNGMYYTCSGSGCFGVVVPLSSQVQNPVALLPQDNNGVIVNLPGVPLGGTPSVAGTLVLGIGTRSNNAPSAVTSYPVDEFGEFLTNFKDTSLSGFIDTGSNGLFFPSLPASPLPSCPGLDSSWFCPSAPASLSATNEGASGSPVGVISFRIGNYDSLITSPNNVFAEIGGPLAGTFDWGLPFFFGRNVYVGFEGTASNLGSGPYWAY